MLETFPRETFYGSLNFRSEWERERGIECEVGERGGMDSDSVCALKAEGREGGGWERGVWIVIMCVH